jgi:hypothetical protein
LVGIGDCRPDAADPGRSQDLKLRVTTDASRVKAPEAGRLLSQELYNRFAVDGVLYLSRLTAAECIAVYDRAVAKKLKASKAIEIARLPRSYGH